LLKKLHNFNVIVAQSASKYKPQLLCTYLIDVARTFNEFYEKCPVLKAEQKEARLSICNAAKQVLANGLGLLGIVAPERM